MKKVCILVSSNKPVPAVKGGAVETLVQNIIDEYEKDTKSQISISVLTIKNIGIDYTKYKKTNFLFIPNFYLKVSPVYWKLTGLVRKLFCKELLAPSTKVYERYFIIRNLKKFDYFIVETDLKSLNTINGIEEHSNKFIYHLHYEGNPSKIVDSRFSHLIAISDYIGKVWIKATGRSQERVHILKNCIDVKKFDAELTIDEINLLKEELGITERTKVIIFVGRIIEEKGVLELIQALNIIDEKDICLLIIGSADFAEKTTTSYERKVEAMCRESKHKVIRLGYVDNSNIYRYQVISDIQVVPSIWQEPAGLVVLEAQAAGLPVIATNVGGIPEFLGNQSGVLVDIDENYIGNLAKNIERLLNDSDLMKAMGKEGKKFAAMFNSRRYYEDFNSILESIYKS
ncbi:MAG: glycosyltransferase family 4 protein [Lachnospiraceae bacterium]